MKFTTNRKMAFFTIKPDEKEAALLYLIREYLKIPTRSTSDKEASDYKKFQTIVFVSTKHHVEYISSLLNLCGNYDVSYIYGALDQAARKTQIENFRKGKSVILVVTDVAARGIDIPILENVINYDFVDSSKVFVHRVGRVARAGRRGWAFSLLTPEEVLIK